MCLKGLKFLFTVADFFILVFVSIVLVMNVELIDAVANTTQQAETYFAAGMLILVPVFYIPFNFKIISEHLNKNGGELLYVYYKNVIWWLLTFLMIYSLAIIPCFIVAFVKFKFTCELILIYYFSAIICCILFLGIIYLAAFITKSKITTMLITCIYFVTCVFGNSTEAWWNFYTPNKISFSYYGEHYLRIWAIALVFIMAGFFFNMKNEKVQ